MRIETTHRVGHPQPEVQAWYGRPGALVRLTPPGLASMDAPGEGGMRAGRLVGTRVGPPALPDLLRPHWILRHAEHDPQAGRFVDQQVRGPWRTWQHEHLLEADGSGTLVHDRIEIEMPRRLERLEPAAASRMRRLLAFRSRQLHDDLAFHDAFAHLPRRTVAITGSSGLIGTQLGALLETGGHTVRRMVRESSVGEGEILGPAQRRAGPRRPRGRGRGGQPRRSLDRHPLDPLRAARDPRLPRERHLAALPHPRAGMRDGPTALVQASAIGLYGPRRPGELLTEEDPGGEGFLADLVRDWEGSTRAARGAGVRVAHVRTGLALSDGGGSLLPQLPLFLAGMGGRLTDAEAMLSWISLDDVVRVFAHAALTADLDGPVNAVAPRPVTALEFARALGAVLHRPALLPVPPFGPRAVLGGAAADELIRTDQRVSSARLEASGFAPAHAELTPALQHLLWR